jgi:hypothetical protein
MSPYSPTVNGKPSPIYSSISRMSVPLLTDCSNWSWLTFEQRGETDFFSGEPLRALSTLVFSDNIDLQRSASLTFAEITERGALHLRGLVLDLWRAELGASQNTLHACFLGTSRMGQARP